ncbi:hypothetical protein HQ571_01915 [Candidatus Kuenenbacteria bacterium]|nr:hypothetical protein [Candidatus Kuenenbacteria bacterium]
MKKIVMILVVVFLMAIAVPQVCFAIDAGVTAAIDKIGTITDAGDESKSMQQIGTGSDLSVIVGTAISNILGIIGAVTLVVFIISGIMWMTSSGNAKKVESAQKSMIWAGLGLFVIFISYILVKYIIQGLDF